MKVLVLGAGATYAEALYLGIPKDHSPPLMNNLSKSLWQSFNPHPFLDKYLESMGYAVTNEDGRSLYFKLEKKGKVNIEKFFEFCWVNRDQSWSWSQNPLINSQLVLTKNDHQRLPPDFIQECLLYSSGNKSHDIQTANKIDFWDNMMYHGFGDPFMLMMINCFHENGKGVKSLLLTQKAISILRPGDIVINLNYDTVFELALKQAGKSFCYLPTIDPIKIMVCKPHGSLNMVVKPNHGFSFGNPEWWGMPQPPIETGLRSFIGIIPPRFNKSYEQNPVSKTILESIKNIYPEKIIFWGVGLTESDVDLVELFQNWKCVMAHVINPDKNVSKKVRKILRCKIKHFENLDTYIE